MDEMTQKVKRESVDPIKGRNEPIQSDILGSYTGRMKDPYEIPVQDADDL